MKANQHQRTLEDDRNGVSPIIAVILMVAITVVLAATVFVLVSDIGQNAQAPSQNSFDLATDSSAGKASVTSASPGASWGKIQVSLEIDGEFRLNMGAWTTMGAGTWYTVSATDRVQAGDQVSFCTTPMTPSTTRVEARFRDSESNSLVETVNFNGLPLCP